jgi:hypothetical protein
VLSELWLEVIVLFVLSELWWEVIGFFLCSVSYDWILIEEKLCGNKQ